MSLRNPWGCVGDSASSVCRIQRRNTNRNPCAIFYKYLKANKLLKYVLSCYKYPGTPGFLGFQNFHASIWVCPTLLGPRTYLTPSLRIEASFLSPTNNLPLAWGCPLQPCDMPPGGWTWRRDACRLWKQVQGPLSREFQGP